MSAPTKTDQSSTSAATPVKQISMAQAEEIILESMFYKYQGARPELDDRLRKAFKANYGFEMMDMLPSDEMRSIYLEGSPGHGKTATHECAARRFAKLMGMNFIKNPTLQMVSSGMIGMNDFVYTVIELAGETSNKEVAGLMTKMKVEMPDGVKLDFMGHVQDWRLAATSMAGFGYVNWDDFVTASHQVQNAMLGMLLNGKSSNTTVTMNDLITSDKLMGEDGELVLKLNPEKAMRVRENASSIAMGLCGNRGVRDGNQTYELTTASANRIVRFDVFDTLENFKERTLTNKNDETSDAGLLGFLEANRDFFFKLAMRSEGLMGQSATSRSWDALMTQLRTITHRNGGLSSIASMSEEGQMKVLNDIMIRTGGTVGTEAEVRLGAYYTQLFVGAAPIADKIISKGEVDVDKIEEKYANGKSAQGMNFGYSFASALSSFAAAAIPRCLKDNKKSLTDLNDPHSDTSKSVREVLRNFSYGLNQLSQGSLRSFALDQLMRRLRTSVPSMFTSSGENYRIPTQSAAVLLAYGLLIDNQKYNNPAYVDDITSTLTQTGGFEDPAMFSKNKAFAGTKLGK